MIHERVRACSGFSAVRFSALGVAAVLMLAGCSGGGEPGAEAAEGTSSSASPSGGASASGSAPPTPTPTPTAAAYKPASAEGPAENVPLPVMPELAKQESSEGLQAFARHWYELVNYGFETGDVEPLRQISGAECVVCMSVYDILGHGFIREDWILGGKVEVLGTQSNYVITNKGYYQVLIHLRQDPYEYRGAGNQLYEANQGFDGNTVQMIEATYGNGQWFANNAVTIK